MTLALLCPGQGAQQVGMGKDFYATYGVARRVYDQADKALGFALSKLCFEGPEDTLNKTDVAQLAIFVTSVAIYETLLELGKTSVPDYAAGLSLGEYTALHIAGVFSFEDGLTLVKARGSLMQAAAEAQPSSMLAILGTDEAGATALCQEAAQGECLIPANFNTGSQIILSGSVAACRRAADLAHAKSLHALPLKVAGAFHSPFMQSAADQLAEVLNSVPFNMPTLPVISNVSAQPHINPASIRESLIQQVVAPVRWYQSIQKLIGLGVNRWIEVGPGRSLTGMLKKIDRKAPIENFSLAEGLPPAKSEIGVTDIVTRGALFNRQVVK
jgi:[acyl-carrier-protein] S-malonyltransferase